jgi:hypothetical protein
MGAGNGGFFIFGKKREFLGWVGTWLTEEFVL